MESEKDQTEKVVIYASAYVQELNGQFVPGIALEINGEKLDVVVDGEAFDTQDDCVAFLTNEMQNIVNELCDKLGFDVLRTTLGPASSKNSH